MYKRQAQDAGCPTLYCEISPFSGRITLDPKGVNYEGSVPGFDAPFASPDPAALRRIRDGFAPRANRREQANAAPPPGLDEPFVFCPLQVPNDSQVRVFSGPFRSMERFVAVVGEAAQHLPEGWHLRLREHPTAKQTLVEHIAPWLGDKLRLDNTTDAFEQMDKAQAVLTLNSSMGLQALFSEKPVLVAGKAFYGRSELVQLCENAGRIKSAFQSIAQPSKLPVDRDRFLQWLVGQYYPEYHRNGTQADNVALLRKHIETSPIFQHFRETL